MNIQCFDAVGCHEIHPSCENLSSNAVVCFWEIDLTWSNCNKEADQTKNVVVSSNASVKLVLLYSVSVILFAQSASCSQRCLLVS